MKKWEEIEQLIKNEANIYNIKDVETLLAKLSTYHEELVLQNEELKRINEYLEELKNDYRNLFYSAPVAYFVIDNYATIIEANNIAMRLFGDVLSKKITQYLIPTSKNDFYIFLSRLFHHKENRTNASFITKNKSIHMEVIGKEISSDNNKFLITCIDFEKHYQTLEETSRFSYKDHLTGLYNRRFFEKSLRSISEDLLPVSVIIADANGLKVINDSFGHAKGDELLQNASQVLLNNTDPNNIIARMGGDEFAVLCTNTSAEECEDLVKNYYKSSSKLVVDNIKFSLSYGFDTIYSITDDFDDLIVSAEKKMYSKKIKHELQNNSEIVDSIFTKLREKHPEEKMHSERVASYMKRFGKYLDYDEDRIKAMYLSGLMHNLGKIATEENILRKSYPLTISDYAEIKKHPEVAYRILKSSSKYSKIAHIVLFHHEWVNGDGYPKGLKDKDIPLLSKILSVVEAYVSMTSDKPYRSAMTKNDAIAELEAYVGTQFDRRVVEKFVEMLKKEN